MNKIEKTIYYIKLFNVYKDLLSLTQKEVFADYYLLDLSISEIAENRDISRSAVEDALNKGTSKMIKYEEKLQIVERIGNIKEGLEELKKKALNQQKIEEIEKIEKELDYYGI